MEQPILAGIWIYLNCVAREIKKPPINSKSINVTNFQQEHYKEELGYFLKTGEQTGFNAPNDAIMFDD